MVTRCNLASSPRPLSSLTTQNVAQAGGLLSGGEMVAVAVTMTTPYKLVWFGYHGFCPG